MRQMHSCHKLRLTQPIGLNVSYCSFGHVTRTNTSTAADTQANTEGMYNKIEKNTKEKTA